MILDPLVYVRADSTDDAVACLDKHGDGAKVIAGGHSLVPLMKLGLVVPEVLIDISRVSSLDFIEERADRLVIGAGVTHAALASSRAVRDACPMLSYAASLVGDPAVRHRGTIGGSIAHGDPAGDLPTVALALDAELVVVGPGGRRLVLASDFFLGFWETALAPNEILSEVRFPRRTYKWAYEKFARRSFDWAIVGIAVVGAPDSGVQIALSNMSSRPVRAIESENALRRGASVPEAALLVSAGLDPPSDVNASTEFRRHLAEVLCRRMVGRVC